MRRLAFQAAQTPKKSKVFPAYQPNNTGGSWRTKLPRSVWCGEGSKVFFSEEKKQKTFDFSGVCAAWKANRRIK